MEIAGEVDDFVAAVSRIPGLEFLAEELGEKYDTVDLFAEVDPRTGRRKPLRRELFMVASDERAAGELERLWDRWQNEKNLPRPYGSWRSIFERLDVVRRWNDTDRLKRSGALAAWEEELRGAIPNQRIPFEVELWYRADEARRTHEQQVLTSALARAGGRVISDFVLPEIAYHGVLAEADAAFLLEMVDSVEARWMSGSGIRFFRASGQASIPTTTDMPSSDVVTSSVTPSTAERLPRVALLDGIPVAGHHLLRGRIVLDDPEGWEETSEVRHRQHGTAMTSAILHGDLAGTREELSEPLYVRPIIRVDPQHSWVPQAEETVPVHRLPVELVYEAVTRMFGGTEPRAPEVRIVNISVGDRAQIYDRFLSPWARLLDFLASTYEILFVVSAGNHDVEFQVPDDLELDNSAETISTIFGELARTATERRLLAPAESVNALTVGALHDDDSAASRDGRIDLIADRGFPSPCSSWGSGHGRAIKPDALAPGGRTLYDLQPRINGEQRRFTPSYIPRPPGVQVGSPGRAGNLGATSWTRGTSVAAALTTRAGVRLLQRIDALRSTSSSWQTGGPSDEFDAVLVKALLVHGTTWDPVASDIRDAMQDAMLPSSKEDFQRALGYGAVRPDWPLTDDDHRVTGLFAARLGDGTHEYRLPLPGCLASEALWRRLTITLAWFTPVNHAHRRYRRAALWFEPPSGALRAFADRRQEASNLAARRGTVQHEIIDGRTAVPYVDGDELSFVVNCRPNAGSLDAEVPYAFVVTLETAEELRLPVYAEVSARLRQRTRIRQTQ